MSFQHVYKIIHFYLNYIIIHFKLFKIRQMRFVKFLNNSKKLSPCLALPKVYEYTRSSSSRWVLMSSKHSLTLSHIGRHSRNPNLTLIKTLNLPEIPLTPPSSSGNNYAFSYWLCGELQPWVTLHLCRPNQFTLLLCCSIFDNGLHESWRGIVVALSWLK